MERNGDLRRGGFGLTQRRRAGFRDSPGEESRRQVELQEMVRFRDREVFQKKDRDREVSKRRRVDRQQHRNESYREVESSESSDEEYDEDEDELQQPKIHHQNRMNPPPPPPEAMVSSARLNNRRRLRTLRSTPVVRSPIDELIGVPIPRRARSSSFKRVHEHWSSGSGGLGDELNRRRFSASPATGSPIGHGGSSPSTSGGSSMRKRMKSVEPRNRTLNSNASDSRPSASAPNAIEFEVAQVLFELMQQSESEKNGDGDGDCSIPADDEGKRVKADENGGSSIQIEERIKADAVRVESNSAREMEKDENGEKESEMGDDKVQDELLVNNEKESESPSSCGKVNACEFQDSTVTKTVDGTVKVEGKKDGSLDIDLMAPLTLASSRGKGISVDTESDPMVMTQDIEENNGTVRKEVSPASDLVQAEKSGTTSSSPLQNLDMVISNGDASTSDGSKQQPLCLTEQKNLSPNSFLPFPVSMNGWPGVLPPHPGYIAPLQAVMPIDGSTRSLTIAQSSFKFSQPRKRCATHQFIAKNIQAHQELVNKTMESGYSGTTNNLYGMKHFNLNAKSQPENHFFENGGPKVAAISGVSGKDNNSEVAKLLNTSTSNKLVPQQALDHTSAQKFLQGPALIFPFGHHQSTTVTPSSNVQGQHLSAAVVGDASMPSNSALNLCLPAMSFNHQNMAASEAAYMAMLQKNGCPFPIPPNIAMQKNGSQVPVVPFFNPSFYSSPVFNLSQNQQHVSLPHSLAQSTSQNTSTSSGSSSRKPPLGQKQAGANINDGKSSADAGRNPLIPSTGQMFSNPIQPMNGEPKQKGLTSRVDFSQQALAMPFGSNPSMNSALSFHMPQNAYQRSFQASDGKSVIASANLENLPKSIFGTPESTGAQSLNFNKSGSSDVSASMGASMFDSLARNMNMGSSAMSGKQDNPSSGTSVSIQNFHQHQHQHHQQLLQLQKHHMQQMQLNGAKDGIPGSFLSSNFPSTGPIFSGQWDNLPRTTAPDGSSQPSANSINSILMSFPPQIKGPQGQTHISFGNMPGSSGSFQGQQQHIRSPSHSSKNVAGSPRNPSTPSQQQVDVPQSGSSQKSSPACRRNVASILNSCPSQPSELKY